MAGIFERVGALAGTELAKAADFAQHTFQDRVNTHHHVGRGLVETAAELCRNHPNLVGLGAGLMVEQLLVHEKQRYDAQSAAAEHPESADTPFLAIYPSPFGPHLVEPLKPEVKNADTPHPMLRLSQLKPGRVAAEVFGALVLLKLAATGAKMFRHKHQGEAWFAAAAKIHLFSGAIAAYNLTAAIRSPKISAWRNGAILLFGTDAVKPVLKSAKGRKAAPPERPVPTKARD